MRITITTVLWWLLLSFGVQAFSATKPPVEINSFEVKKINQDTDDVDFPNTVSIDLIATNAGTESLCLGAIAKSQDGTIRSPGFIPQALPAGKDIRIPIIVLRPLGLEPETTVLMVMFYECGKNISSRFKLNWTFKWPLQSFTSENVNSEVEPWEAFYETMREQDYEALDLMLEKWNDPRQRDVNGGWKLDGYIDGVSQYIRFINLKEFSLFALDWKKTAPNSFGALIAEVSYWDAYAWQIRDYENEQEEDPLALEIFNERLKRVDQLLVSSKKYASNNPLWYKYSLKSAIALKNNTSIINGIFSEAINKYPNYQPLYEEMISYWAPVRGKANWSKVDEIIDLSVDMTSSTEGKSNYAWLYSQLFHQQRVEVDILKDSKLSWIKMKTSFEELVQRYPSHYNLNRYAMFACKAGDKVTYLTLRPRIRNNIVKDAWPSNNSLNLCDHRFMTFS